jgi:hypothetical protein
MAQKQNPETGEWYEDYSDAYQAEASNLPPLAEPPGSSVDFAGQNYTTPLITGYGGRTAILRPGEEPTNEWGAKVSPEYVKDIEDVFTSDNPEEAATRKMASRPPSRPSESDLNYYDELQKFRKVAQGQIGIDPEKEGQKAFNERIDAVMKNYGYTDRALLKPADKAKIQQEAQAQLNHEMGIADQAFKIGWDKKEKDRLEALKAPTDDQRLERELTATLGHKPTDAEFNAKKQERAVEVASAKERGKVAAQKGMLSPDTLEQAYQYVKTKGEFAPEIARLFRVPGAQIEVMDYAAKRAKEEGGSGEDRVVKGAIQKSVASSLNFQEKQRGAMGSFVSNINRQISRVENIEKEISRLGVRFLDVPVRELVARAKGSGKERALESYISEISSEISKLQQGSQASIQQLPVETQKKWDRIHDLYLPWSELKIVMENTRTQANDRIKSVDDEIKFTQEKLRGYGIAGKDNGGPPASSLREGIHTKFANGQTWTLENGKRVQVR